MTVTAVYGEVMMQLIVKEIMILHHNRLNKAHDNACLPLFLNRFMYNFELSGMKFSGLASFVQLFSSQMSFPIK